MDRAGLGRMWACQVGVVDEGEASEKVEVEGDGSVEGLVVEMEEKT